MEQVETRGVTVGSGTVFSGTFDGEVDQTTVGRAEVAVFVHHFHCHISEVFAVCRQFVPVADQFDVMRLACGAYTLFCYCFSVFFVGYYFQLTRIIYGIHPHQTLSAYQ